MKGPRGHDPPIEDHCSRDLQVWSGELSVTQELIGKTLRPSPRIPEPDPAFQQDAHEIILGPMEGRADLSKGTNRGKLHLSCGLGLVTEKGTPDKENIQNSI